VPEFQGHSGRHPSRLRSQSRIVAPEHLEWFSTFFFGGSPVSERTVALQKKGISNVGFLTHRVGTGGTAGDRRRIRL
jgi:hypothetical protein